MWLIGTTLELVVYLHMTYLMLVPVLRQPGSWCRYWEPSTLPRNICPPSLLISQFWLIATV